MPSYISGTSWVNNNLKNSLDDLERKICGPLVSSLTFKIYVLTLSPGFNCYLGIISSFLITPSALPISSVTEKLSNLLTVPSIISPTLSLNWLN